MRIVLGYSSALPELVQRRPFPGRNDEMLCYGLENAPLVWNPLTTSCAELETQYPEGWRPDLFFCASLEYFPIPVGVEDLDCLTFGVVGDWNLGGQALQQVGGAFDILIADKNGCERLRSAGFSNVIYAPLWSFDPAVHRPMPGVERDIDVLMIGNFNHDIQRERAKWLARVARLSRRYNVVVTSGIFGDEYARMMNRAKIVFNRSIRGELNMRAYEAPACGAMLLYERENPEIETMFRDRSECVLYGEDDLEELIAHYLENDAARERIAAAGQARVQHFTWSLQGARMLNEIEANIDTLRDNSRRPFRTLPRGERLLRRANQWMLMPKYETALIDNDLAQAERLLPGRADVVNARAWNMIESVMTFAPGAPDRQATLKSAAPELLRALSQQPDYAAGWFNLGIAHLELGETDSAERAFGRVAEILRTPAIRAEQVRGPYPVRYTGFRTEIELAWSSAPFESPEWTAALRDTLLWRTFELLSDLHFASRRFEDAFGTATEAVALRPTIGTTRARLARAQRSLGRLDESIASFALALEDAALNPQMWTEFAQTLIEDHQYDRCLTFLAEVEAVLDGCPPFAWYRDALNALRTAANAAARFLADGPLRVLAFPEWDRDEAWKPLIRSYIIECERPETTLVLPVRDGIHPSANEVLAAIGKFVKDELERDLDAIPDIVLQPIPPATDEQLFSQADALLSAHGGQSTAAAKLPVVTLEQLKAPGKSAERKRAA